jgi:hypothetical protein
MNRRLSHNRKHTTSVLTGKLRWRGRVLEQEWQYTETETDEIACESRISCVTFKWYPVPEFIQQ